MNTFLQVVGAAFLGIIALTLILIVVVVLVIRSKLKKFAKDLGQMAEGMGTTDWTTTPARIHLQARDSLAWNNLSGAETAIKAFQDAGFTEAGNYEVQEMPGLRLRGFAHEADGLWGVVYEREPVGVWADAVFYGADGTGITVTNAPAGSELDTRPGRQKIYLPGTDAATLILKLREEVNGRVPHEARATNFAPQFEKVYAEEMDWRNSRGGPTLDEIKRIALRSGVEVDDEIIEAQFETARMQAAMGLEVALREKYLEENNLSALEWDRIRNRIVFMHEKYTPEMLENRLYEWSLYDYDEEEEETGRLNFDKANFDPRREFQTANQKAPAEQRFEKIGELTTPVQADVYVAPRDIDYD